MNANESIIKNKASGSRTYFKNEIGEKEYSAILKKQSRRRRTPHFERNEVQVVKCPACGSTEFFIDQIRFSSAGNSVCWAASGTKKYLASFIFILNHFFSGWNTSANDTPTTSANVAKINQQVVHAPCRNPFSQ